VTVEHTACAGCLRTAVIAGLDPAIHRLAKKDGRAGKPAHDGVHFGYILK